MKATIASLCFLASAVCVIALLPKSVCRAPHAISSCAGTAKTMWYFDKNSNKCVSYTGCGKGYNDFGSEEGCKDSCPYGKVKLNAQSLTQENVVDLAAVTPDEALKLNKIEH
ncbi:WAP, Kazal, immunoglobulin, Kunitz and NTR domain-containing protein 2-like [Ixodes scapularis]|uniref:WAP, Kazal, immunoglobulin, Kunitz and NTR domain-containing protein 2-like n=1 Tax=Ixodes scapularis TaxID=6945 RepID=UPI001A9D958F|nr:WAP, Kazal, immunoglobulin, Kunitz and NTR domain-containing protein 2-like [Ixodes scapularis]